MPMAADECLAARGAGTSVDADTSSREAHLYIQPSITAESGDQEGIPVSLMEAMASRDPGRQHAPFGIPELVIDGQTGLLTVEHDAESTGRRRSSG